MKEERAMSKRTFAWVLILGLLTFGAVHPRPAAAHGSHRPPSVPTLVKFKGAIGVIPASSATGTVNANGTFPDVNRNVVRGISPPGQPWRIADLTAEVKTDGSIKVRGKGLLLAGGDGIGSNANQSVFATLICEATSPFSLHSTTLTGVPLDPDGDFRIDDVLTPAPSDCPSPVLLIRNVAGSWFAAGIVQQDGGAHDD
jgi:hypothetical protein